MQQYNEFNKAIKQKTHYIYDFNNSRTSDLHRLLLNLSDKADLKRSNKYVSLSNISIYYKWKNIKKVVQK